MKRPLLAVVFAALPLLAFAEPDDRSTPRAFGQQDEGRALVEENCFFCHDDSYIRSARLDREQWEEVLDMMIGMGMPPLESDVQEKVLDYLEEEHGPRAPSGNSAGAPAGDAASVPGADDLMDELPWAYPRYRPNPLYWRER